MWRVFFDSLESEFFEQMGAICLLAGIRPSEMFEWNNPDEWDLRMKFDLTILGLGMKKLFGGEEKKGKKIVGWSDG